MYSFKTECEVWTAERPKKGLFVREMLRGEFIFNDVIFTKIFILFYWIFTIKKRYREIV